MNPKSVVGFLDQVADIVQQGRRDQGVVRAFVPGQSRALQTVLQHGHVFAIGLTALGREKMVEMIDESCHGGSLPGMAPPGNG